MLNDLGSNLPDIAIERIHIKNLKAYEDCSFNFTDNGKPKKFVCFIGDNGIGKSTALNAIQLIFSRYEGYDKKRMEKRMAKYIRHDKYPYDSSNSNFLIEADINTSLGDYVIQFDKHGFIKDHPKEIKNMLYRLCYYARFDMELHNFQLIRDKWTDFKTLFESVTGYEINEIKDVFSFSEDPLQSEMMEKYILGFTVKKQNETIYHKECSNGEKKVIKSFSTLLNLDIPPKIILIDDIAMHVALDRHIPLIESMKKCYPNSQIFSTTHSYRMTKDLSKCKEIYDLRIIRSPESIKQDPWRLRFLDEIEDALYKLEGILASDFCENKEYVYQKILDGKKIKSDCYLGLKDLGDLSNKASIFLKEVSDLYIKGVLSV